MPILILKALDCDFTHSTTVDFLRLRVTVDGTRLAPIKRKVGIRERWVVDRSIPFRTNLKVELITAGTIKLGGTLIVMPETLPHLAGIGRPGFHRGKKRFHEAAADYTLWYEVIPDGMSATAFHAFPILTTVSLRDSFGRMGRGALALREQNEVLGSRQYRCSEVISLRDAFDLHGRQDGNKNNTHSVRRWIARHCNIWGEESVIPVEDLPEALTSSDAIDLLAEVLTEPQWRPVKDERSNALAGFVVGSRITDKDNPSVHMTRDWLFDVVPSPAFSYMLAYTAKSSDVDNPTFDSTPIPRSHNEWESGSMPEEWRPRVGEYVTIWGRHVFDRGHMPMTTEIHPPHTIVREFTLPGGKVNRTQIGMGLSGGFPGSIEAETKGELNERWQAEFGGFPDDLSRRNRRCWATNLKQHPLRLKIFPPAPRPHAGAVLQSRSIDWRIIKIRKRQINDFLTACKGGAGQTDHVDKAFDAWLAEGLEKKPVAFRPVLVSHGNHFELMVDLTLAEDIPVAYFAVVDCSWSEG